MTRFFLAMLIALPTVSIAQFSIGHRSITFNDPDRTNRAITCEIYYPSQTAGDNVPIANGTFPVIVFGHGFAMQVGAYPNLWNEYVPQGYIMVLPTTEGSFLAPNHAAFGTDLRFLVGEMQQAGADGNSPFFQAVSERSALMGHSMGGGAAILGAFNFEVDCVIGLAPAETDPSAISAAASVTAPVLIFSGSSDGVTPPEGHHIPIYNAAASDCKYFVSIENGSHCHFASNTVTCTLGEIIPGSLPAEDQRQATYAVLTPWLAYFLQDSCARWDDFQTALSTTAELGTINSSCNVPAPIITDNGGTMMSDIQPNYQWYFNGTPIPGADQQAYTYTQSGQYQVASTILGHCPTFSDPLTVQITGMDQPEIRAQALELNTIALQQLEPNSTLLTEWYDVAGRTLEPQRLARTSTAGSVQISVPTDPGLKLLRIRTKSTVKTFLLY